MSINEVFNEMLKDSEGTVNLKIDGYTCSGAISGDAGAIIISIRSLVAALAKSTGKSEEEIMKVVDSFIACSRTLTAESKEQLDVMVELINKI